MSASEPWERARSAQVCTVGCSAAAAANGKPCSGCLIHRWSAGLKLNPTDGRQPRYPAEEQTPIHTVDLQLRRLVQNTVTEGESA